MNNHLTALAQGLRKNFVIQTDPAKTRWADPDAPMTKALNLVKRDFTGAGLTADSATIMSAVSSFAKTGNILGFRELKYICLGMSAVNLSGWCLLSEPKLRQIVFDSITNESEVRRQLRCFQGLLSSYWAFPLSAETTSAQARKGWQELRDFLATIRKKILVRLKGEFTPEWLLKLGEHSQLLTENPCHQYGPAMLRGDLSGLRDAIDGLAIPQESWVFEEAIVSHIIAASNLMDQPFKESLELLVPIALGQGEIKISDHLVCRCIAVLVSRYAKCRDNPEFPALRDAAVSKIGNPWLQRTKWDTWVRESKGPDDQAREMVNGWLKRRLITDFFALLAIDGAGDRRRVDYWLRFEPYISDMWFALGPDSRSGGGRAFTEFREAAKGRLLNLDTSQAENNAFIMRIGEYLAVEFGAKGNAFFLFKWHSLSKTIVTKLTSGLSRVAVSQELLKDKKTMDLRLIHMDTRYEKWEKKFDEAILPRIGHDPRKLETKVTPTRVSSRFIQPPLQGINRVTVEPNEAPEQVLPKKEQTFSELNLKQLAIIYGLTINDLREKGGALWVENEKLQRPVVTLLRHWGFALRVGRGWYKE
jgi:hypothetical protein